MAGFMKSAMNLFGIKKGDGAPALDMSLQEFLEEVANLAGFNVEFSMDGEPSEEEGTKFEISGEDAEEFLGNNTEMLESLAHLAMRFQRRTVAAADDGETRNLRVTFDSGDFRKEKNQRLHDLAESKRKKVIDNEGKPAYINALGPSERKIIHTYITETQDVVSESIGSGYFKRIRIRMKDDTRKHSDNEGRRGGRGGNGGGNRNSRRGGKGGSGPGRGRNGGSGGGNRHNGNSDRPNQEVNGNVLAPENEYDEVDENIGNKLKPGEEPIFSFDVDNDRN